MQESKCKLDYVLSPYTKIGVHTSMLKCYSTAPFGFFTEKKLTKKDRNFHYCTCSTSFNGQHMREVKTCRAQYQFLQFVSAQGCSSLEVLQGTVLCTQGPDDMFHGCLLVRWKHHSAQAPYTHFPRAPSVPPAVQLAPQPCPARQVCNNSG